MKKFTLKVLSVLLLLIITAAQLVSCSNVEDDPGIPEESDTPEIESIDPSFENSRFFELIMELHGDAVENGYTGGINEYFSSLLASDTATEQLALMMNLRSTVAVTVTYQKMVKVSPTTSHSQTVIKNGSGVVYSIDKEKGDAYIITSDGVVFSEGNEREIKVCLYGSKEAIPAVYVGELIAAGVAVLKIEGSELIKSSNVEAIKVADSYEVTEGDRVVSIGNVGGEGVSVTSGIVSVASEYVAIGSINYRVIRIDASVNPGNSGGGLFNSSGELIGIVDSELGDKDTEGIGYAYPSDYAIWAVQKIIDCDKDETANLQKWNSRLRVEPFEQKAMFNRESGKLERVERVRVKMVLDKAGVHAISKLIKEGDIINSVTVGEETFEITRMYIFEELLYKVNVGQVLVFNIERDGQVMDVSVEVSEEDMSSVK